MINAQIILKYLDTQNRPYNALMLYENLHGAVGKTQATKLMAEMAEKQVITGKEYGKQKLYWKNQNSTEGFDPESLAALDKKIKELESEKSSLSEQCQQISSGLKELTSKPTNKEADEKMELLEEQNAEFAEKVQSITGNTVVITPEEKKKVEKEYEKTKQVWRKRKRLCKEICSHLEEASGKRFKELKEELGLETDEDHNLSTEIDETTKVRKGETA